MSRNLFENDVASLETLDVVRGARSEDREFSVSAQHAATLPQYSDEHRVVDMFGEIYRCHLVERRSGEPIKNRSVEAHKVRVGHTGGGDTRMRSLDCRRRQIDADNLLA